MKKSPLKTLRRTDLGSTILVVSFLLYLGCTRDWGATLLGMLTAIQDCANTAMIYGAAWVLDMDGKQVCRFERRGPYTEYGIFTPKDLAVRV